MNEHVFPEPGRPHPQRKFAHPDITAKGERRASVDPRALETLWFNTGTLCNIECANCYIESSPANDRLVYLTRDDVTPFLDEIETLGLGTREIGFTGGEPFMNPDMIAIARDALDRGFDVLILTNAMQPMLRPRVKDGLAALIAEFGPRLTLRVSLDHHSRELHERERGPGTWDKAMEGLRWLSAQGARLAIAGRTCWDEEEPAARAGYAALFAEHGIAADAADPASLVLFPEMDEGADVPEITVDCWSILGKDPQDIMCASSRMVVRRKGATKPVVQACTLLAYDENFEMGATLREALQPVRLNHPHCAKFCVLGGGSCSA